jgi:hypothetical protein
MHFYILIALTLKLTSCASNLIFHLDSYETSCFSEYFADKTLVIIEVHSNTTSSEVKVTTPDSAYNFLQRDKNEYKHAFTTYSGGDYEICIMNTGRDIIEVMFNMKHGVSAKDFSSMPKYKDLKPSEQELFKLEERTNEIWHSVLFAGAHEQIFENILDGLTSKIVWLSVLLIIVMVTIGAIETLYLRNYLTKRKTI